ncbi:hypothetical protein KUCAC02_035118, partial [Chaenocephalus aceratus]
SIAYVLVHQVQHCIVNALPKTAIKTPGSRSDGPLEALFGPLQCGNLQEQSALNQPFSVATILMERAAEDTASMHSKSEGCRVNTKDRERPSGEFEFAVGSHEIYNSVH